MSAPKTTTPKHIARVAVPLPLRNNFEFLVPPTMPLPTVGSRVRVPFGNRELIGLVISLVDHSSYPVDKLKPIKSSLDSSPVFEPELTATLKWLAGYYLAPLGEVIDAALPVVLRRGQPLEPAAIVSWQLSDYGRSAALDELQRAPLQLALIKRFVEQGRLSSSDFSTGFKDSNRGWRQALNTLVNKGWLSETLDSPKLAASQVTKPPTNLNSSQQHAVAKLQPALLENKFNCALLHGVTGSGKTEVYFAAMRCVIEQGQQVLLLVPEIGLTPQLINRIKENFSCPVVALHSGMNNSERHLAWWHARQGQTGIVVGTRSAVFTPIKTLGLIVVDEEHDASFKQQDGVRYQARDVAIYRAKQSQIPILLGSATPSLESFANAQQGRYQYLELPTRATAAALPEIKLLDTRRLPTSDGLSPPLLEVINRTIDDGEQIMLFLNRRGYAPVMYCKDCGATSTCHRCDSHLTLHRRINRVRCHHCGYEAIASNKCDTCQQPNLAEVGEGTQRVEEALAARFPTARIARIDRDSTRRKGELETILQQAADHQFDILLGTQLLTKGHDFAAVTAVGVLGADQGLYSTDFRASENMFQQLIQVAGRAGRRQQQGKVYIQTAFPEHPFFGYVCQHDYHGFANYLLAERAAAGFPPYGHFAVLRAESTHQAKALQFLRTMRQVISSCAKSDANLKLMDAVPAPMERRAGRYRAQLLLSSNQRSILNSTLKLWLDQLDQQPTLKKLAATVRWSLDIDPADLY